MTDPEIHTDEFRISRDQFCKVFYIFLASFIAYLVGEISNSFVLSKMKQATQGRWLWTRTIGSTLVGQALDSLIFITIAFYNTIPTEALLTAVITQWLVKSLFEAAFTPITYIVVNFLKRKEGIVDGEII